MGSGQKLMTFLKRTTEVLSIDINKGLLLIPVDSAIKAKQSRFCYNITIKSYIQIINELPINLKDSNNSLLARIKIKVPYYQCWGSVTF
jgi:hypothetical protein